MKPIIQIILMLALCCMISLRVSAQDMELTSAEKKYYNEYPEKILPDAKNSFTKSEYLQTQKLCRFHSFVLMDEQVSERTKLWDDAKSCATLSAEMMALKENGKIMEAKKNAESLLRINPNDKDAKEIMQIATKPTGIINGHEWVDLGLSVKWATCNVGASSPEEYGDYYAWGEIETKAEYRWTNYKFWKSGSYSDAKFNKYNTKSDRGRVDNKTTLEMADDVARVKMGGNWRIPTKAEFDELKDNCTCAWTTQGGHNGYKLTSKKNGNSIFLPAAGSRDGKLLQSLGSYGYYWSSSLDDYFSHYAYAFDCEDFRTETGYHRCDGRSVRPVTE